MFFGFEGGAEYRELYVAGSGLKTGHLQVTPLHSIYYEVSGNPTGPTALVVHGGPGAGCYKNHA